MSSIGKASGNFREEKKNYGRLNEELWEFLLEEGFYRNEYLDCDLFYSSERDIFTTRVYLHKGGWIELMIHKKGKDLGENEFEKEYDYFQSNFKKIYEEMIQDIKHFFGESEEEEEQKED